MKNYNWNYPTNIWVGIDRVKDLYLACSNLNIQNPLFVTDKDLIDLPMVKKIISEIKNKIEKITIFSNFSGNPFGENVDEGVKEFKKNNCDGVIAFGGGSGLDVGKAIAFMSAQTRPIWDFEDIGEYWKRANDENIAPIIAIPTTAGTGSETGRASAIINKETGIKKIIFHPKFLPAIVILDPILTKDLSPRLTGATGMDALAHNLEAFCAPGFHPMADGIALEGMRMINQWLLKAVKDGSDIEARMNMLAAASMGSTAFQKGLGAIHSLSHPVNSLFNVHHGLSNGIFMPYVLTFNRSTIENKIAKLSEYLDLKEASFNSFVDWVLELREQIKIPHTISESAKITDKDIEKMSPMALDDPCTPGNPKKTTLDDMISMYQHSVQGKLL